MTYTADPGMGIGHAHLKVSDLDRSIAFYRDVIGLQVQQRRGRDAAFLSAGGYLAMSNTPLDLDGLIALASD